MPPSSTGYALIGLTAIVAVLISVLTFAVLRFVWAARDARRSSQSEGRGEVTLLSAALHEAVTKLKEQERATAARAEASERLSSEIVASLTAGLLVVDSLGEVKILNPAGRRLLQVREGAYARSARDQPLWEVIDECLRTGVAAVRRSAALPEVGRGVYLGITVSPLFGGSGQPHGAICLFSDLTGIRALEDQLRLKESLATVGELTAGIAHEFRNGLATIHGYGKLFDLKQLSDTHRTYVEGIVAETEALSQVVTNFLNFARPADLTLTRVELRSICERAVDEIRSDVLALGGEVRIAGEFGAVDGDEVLLRQAFSNLLRNAMEACADLSRPPRVGISSEIDPVRRESRLTVDDNGTGIAPELREQVFLPFFTSKRNGTGLGLALVQKIIVFHNGRVTVGTSREGGARIQLTLPLSPSSM